MTSPKPFNRILSRLLFGSSVVWALILFLPWDGGRCPWQTEPDLRFVRCFPLLLPALAGLAVATFPWWHEEIEDASLLDKGVFLFIGIGSGLWLLFLALVAFLALTVFFS